MTPGHLRQKTALDSTLTELMGADKVQFIQNGKRKDIHISPVLLKGGGP